MWNTGCRSIHNDAGQAMCVIDAEESEGNPAPLDLPAGRVVDWHGAIVPWCINSGEVMSKAFKFFTAPLPPAGSHREHLFKRDTLPAFYLFQYYRDDQVYYLKPRDGRVTWNERVYCNEGPSSYVDVFVPADQRIVVRTR